MTLVKSLLGPVPRGVQTLPLRGISQGPSKWKTSLNLNPPGAERNPTYPVGTRGRDQGVTGEPFPWEVAQSLRLYWLVSCWVHTPVHTCTHTHQRLHPVLGTLCNLTRQTGRLLLKKQLYSAIFNHTFPCFSYHTWHRLHLHLYQAIAFESIKCNLTRISWSKTLVNCHV